MFQAIYDSPWHNPAAFLILGAAFLALWMRRRPFLVAYVALFALVTFADCVATGGSPPAALARSSWGSAISIAFIILGDFRYFLLVERFARRPLARPLDATAPITWLSAAGLALIVPVGSALVNRALSGREADVRWTYLVYEVMFAALALALRFLVLPRRLAPAPPEVRAWLLAVTSFEIAQYALWALADVIILAGADLGFGLRLIPNFMYYAFFLPFVAWKAPPAERA